MYGKYSFLAGLRGISMLAGFILNIVVASKLANIDYALAMITLGLVNLGALIARNSNHITLTRLLNTGSNAERIETAIRRELTVVFLQSSVMAVFISLLIFLIQSTQLKMDSSIAGSTFLFSLSIIPISLNETLSAICVGKKKPLLSAVISFIIPISILLSLMVGFSVASLQFYYVLFFSAHFLSYILIITYLRFTDSDIPSVISIRTVNCTVNWDKLDITFFTILLFLSLNGELLILSATDNLRDFSSFIFYFKMASAIAMLSALPRIVSGPKLYSLISTPHSNKKLWNLYFQITYLILFLAFLAAVAMYVILYLFPSLSKDYYSDLQIYWLVVLIPLANHLFGPIVLVINLSGDTRFYLLPASLIIVIKFTVLWYLLIFKDIKEFIFGAIAMMLIWNSVLLYLFLMNSRKKKENIL